MKTSAKLTLASLATVFAMSANAHPGHNHEAAEANVVHAVEGVTTTDQDKVAQTEKKADAKEAQRAESAKETTAEAQK